MGSRKRLDSVKTMAEDLVGHVEVADSDVPCLGTIQGRATGLPYLGRDSRLPGHFRVAHTGPKTGSGALRRLAAHPLFRVEVTRFASASAPGPSIARWVPSAPNHCGFWAASVAQSATDTLG